jgi:hypothetical protein
MTQSAYRLATGWTIEGSEFEFRQGQEFSLLHVVQTGYGPSQPLIQQVSECSFTGGKATGA